MTVLQDENATKRRRMDPVNYIYESAFNANVDHKRELMTAYS